MKIAIIGAGLSGLAVCWHMLQALPTATVCLYAPEGIDGSSSSIAAGLLHPYVGARSRLNWMGREGMEETRHLLRISEQALQSPVAGSRLFHTFSYLLEHARRECPQVGQRRERY